MLLSSKALHGCSLWSGAAGRAVCDFSPSATFQLSACQDLSMREHQLVQRLAVELDRLHVHVLGRVGRRGDVEGLPRRAPRTGCTGPGRARRGWCRRPAPSARAAPARPNVAAEAQRASFQNFIVYPLYIAPHFVGVDLMARRLSSPRRMVLSLAARQQRLALWAPFAMARGYELCAAS